VPGFSRPHVRIRPGEHDWADRCATVHLAPRVQSVLSCLARTGKPATLATSGCPFPKLPFSIGEEPSGGNGGFACELRAAVGAERRGGVLLHVGRVLAAVEDVIGRDVDEGSRAAAAARAPAAALTWRAGHGSRPPAASASACVRSSSGRPTATRAVPRRRASWIRQRASWPVWSATTIGRGPDIAYQWAGSSRPSRSPP